MNHFRVFLSTSKAFFYLAKQAILKRYYHIALPFGKISLAMVTG